MAGNGKRARRHGDKPNSERFCAQQGDRVAALRASPGHTRSFSVGTAGVSPGRPGWAPSPAPCAGLRGVNLPEPRAAVNTRWNWTGRPHSVSPSHSEREHPGGIRSQSRASCRPPPAFCNAASSLCGRPCAVGLDTKAPGHWRVYISSPEIRRLFAGLSPAPAWCVGDTQEYTSHAGH